MTTETEKTALGIIIGAAVGDALGAPLEFLPARAPDNFVTEMEGGGVLRWKPGEITDDTIMSLGIQEMYLEKGKYNQGVVVGKWIDWMNTNPKDIGNWTHKALSAWEKTPRNWELRGPENPAVQVWKATGSKSAGNGALMRCPPTVIVHYRNGLGFIPDTISLAEDTHPDPRCVLSCVAINNILKLSFDKFSKHDALELTIKLISDFSVNTTTSIIGAVPVIEALGNAPTHEWEMWENKGYTIDTLQCAVAAWYQNNSFEEGLIKVINRGNDADTVGAVAGALLGGYHGIDSIPTRWLEALQDKQRLTDNTLGLLEIGNRAIK